MSKDKTMLTKTKLLKSIKSMPEKFSLDEIMDRIILLEKIEAGLQDSVAGKTKSTKEAKAKLKIWLK